MNKNTSRALGGVLILLVLGLIVYSINRNSADTDTTINNATSTPVTGNTNTTPVVTNTAGQPEVVTNQTVSTTDTTAVVVGTVVPNGAFTSYWYEYGVTANLGSRTVNQNMGSGYKSINAPAYITGLTKNTNYNFRLVAENQYGKVAGTQFSFKTTVGTQPPVGSAPTVKTLSANNVTRSGANINGTVNPNGANTLYWFEYGTTANLGSVSEFNTATASNGNMNASAALNSLVPNTTYYFRLNAQNQFSTVNGSIETFKTGMQVVEALPTVSTKSASNITTTTATLQALVNPNALDTTYWFEYSTDSVLSTILVKTTGRQVLSADHNLTGVSADVSSLQNKTNYYYRVAAQNSLGIVYSDKVSFKTK
jgi:hypothetical protein